MSTPNKIAGHRDVHPDLAFGAYVRHQWGANGHSLALFPDPANAKGGVYGHINHGSNFAECPACRTAYRVNADEPLFLCTGCGSAWNDHEWAPIIWPRDIERVRNLLCRRPATLITNAPTRNWDRSERLATVKKHNRDYGDEDSEGPPPATLEALAATRGRGR